MIVEAQLQLSQICAHRLEVIMYQSVPGLTIPPGDPRGFVHSHCPGGQVFAQLSLPRGRGIEFKKFFTVLKENCRSFSICFKETRGSLKKQVFLCCFIPIFAKAVDVYCIFNNIDHFWPFLSFSCRCTFQIFRGWRGRRTSHVPPSLPPP